MCSNNIELCFGEGRGGESEKACALYAHESVPNFEQPIKLNVIANEVEKALISSAA